MFLSVIICTHNPNPIVLQRVLEGLAKQTFDTSNWELLVVDNNSKVSVAGTVDLNWHPQSKVVIEENLGLTNARLRGIQESKGELLIFVDDDNILAATYLEHANRIAAEMPFIGAFGGSCIAEFESEPPAWFHTSILGLRKVIRNQWSNSISSVDDCPIGAGLVVRRIVAETYASNCKTDPMRRNLDRSANSLLGAGDFDFAFTACDLGLGRGVFKDLVLTHVIGKERLTETYFLRMKEGIACSLVLLFSIRNGKPRPYRRPFRKRILDYVNALGLKPIQRKILQAKHRGRQQAAKILNTTHS